ncbi:RNA polymerase sigma factor [Phage f2b1]|nr:RNA polymerase sigma factor [Phage f2b1]
MTLIGGQLNLPPPLSTKENKELFKLYEVDREDTELRDRIIEGNMRLVLYIARKFQNTGIHHDDLVSIGTWGMMKAVKTYKTDKATNFATYSTRCVENEILMYLRKHNKHAKVKSLDTVIHNSGDGSELTLEDMLADENIEPMDNFFVKDEDREDVYEAMREALTEDERKIIEIYFLQNLRQSGTGKVLGISQSYVSRLKNRSINKIKKYINKKYKDGSLKTDTMGERIQPVKKTELVKPKNIIEPREENNMSNYSRYAGMEVRSQEEWEAIKLIEETRMGYKEIEEKTGAVYTRIAAFGNKLRSKSLRKEIQREVARKNAARTNEVRQANKEKKQAENSQVQGSAPSPHPVPPMGVKPSYGKPSDYLLKDLSSPPAQAQAAPQEPQEETKLEPWEEALDSPYMPSKAPSSSPQSVNEEAMAKAVEGLKQAQLEAFVADVENTVGAKAQESLTEFDGLSKDAVKESVETELPDFETIHQLADEIAEEAKEKAKKGTIQRSTYIDTTLRGEDIPLHVFISELDELRDLLVSAGGATVNFTLKVNAVQK